MFFLAKFLRDKTADKLKKKSEEDEKPFLDHLEDLRKTLFKIIITMLVVTIGTFAFNLQLLEVIQFPLKSLANLPDDAKVLDTFGAVEGMMLAIKVSFLSGIILSFPLLLFFLGEFILPGLKDNEKKLIMPSLIVGSLLFVGGLCFSYFVVIPRALEFFHGFSTKRGWGYDLRAGYYISFATQMVLVFGISFELPVVVMALVKLEILSHRVMRNTRSTAIVIMVVVSALITPTTDVFTLSLLAGPLIILYEICIWLAWWMEKKRARAERRENEAALREATPLPAPDIDSDSDTGSGDGPDDPDGGDGPDDGGSSGGGAPVAAPHLADSGHIDSDHIESSSPVYDPDNEYREPEDEDESADTGDAEAEPDIAPGGESDDSGSGDDTWNDPHHGESQHDDYHDDPYHYDHGHHDDYYSGPTEELKRELREELGEQIKAELRHELMAELRKELKAKPGKATRIGLDPRRSRRRR